jgi:hypothetical protein
LRDLRDRWDLRGSLRLLRGQLRGLAGAVLGGYLSGFLRSCMGGLLRGEVAPARFFLSASGFGRGFCAGFPTHALPFFFNGLFHALPGFLARLRARGGEIAILATVQIRPRI